ncbi:ketopantoate reductase family protein [Bradyrhizobium sp. 6(2017)]|uniref:ketopantoate reductase family protein n=1 Tax=Bradyrhizobium sp. 6(2017) TaxID=1197460 RepID=UPI00197AFB9B
MRIAVIGAGGFGDHFGARLAKRGAGVGFLARGPRLAGMRANGLVVDGGPERICANTVVADFVLLAVKLWDTEMVVDQIEPMVGPSTTLVSFQNSVLKDNALRNAYGPAQITQRRHHARDFRDRYRAMGHPGKGNLTTCTPTVGWYSSVGAGLLCKSPSPHRLAACHRKRQSSSSRWLLSCEAP